MLAIEEVATPPVGGLVFVAWSAPENAVPPLRPTYDPLFKAGARYPLGLESIEYLDNIWGTAPSGCGAVTCTNYNINWAPYDSDILAAAAYTVTLSSGQVISQPFSLAIPPQWLVNDNARGGNGTFSAPFGDRYLPGWLLSYSQAFTYMHGAASDVYWGIKYGDPTFKARLKNLITEAGCRYDSLTPAAGCVGITPTPAAVNAVALVRVLVGVDGESQPVGHAAWAGAGGSQNGLMYAHQDSVASCTDYQTFVRELCETAKTAFPHKPVVCMVGPTPCGGWYGYEFRRQLWDDPSSGWHVASPTRTIGYSGNAIAPDYQYAEEAPGFSFRPWFYYRSADTVSGYGDPVAFEWWANANVGGYDPYQSLYWPFLSGANWKGDFLLPNSTYNPYRTTFAWDVIDYWLGGYEDRGWVIFRDAEYRNYITNDGYRDISPQGGRGPYGGHLTVLTPTVYPQYCSQAVIAEEASKAPVAAATTVWRPCNLSGSPHYLPTPKATFQPDYSPNPTSDFNMMQRLFNRQALAIDPASSMAIKADPGWTHYGATQPLRVTVSYMDIGSGQLCGFHPHRAKQHQRSPSCAHRQRLMEAGDVERTISLHLECHQRGGQRRCFRQDRHGQHQQVICS